jgi:hypothetical protein
MEFCSDEPDFIRHSARKHWSSQIQQFEILPGRNYIWSELYFEALNFEIEMITNPTTTITSAAATAATS